MHDSGLVCFTNCSLLQEDGSLLDKDLWIDIRRGVIVDAQASSPLSLTLVVVLTPRHVQSVFYLRKERPSVVIDLAGNILRYLLIHSPVTLILTERSPGLIDAQINGAYNFDFSIYDGDDDGYRSGLDMVACRIVETGVTA